MRASAAAGTGSMAGGRLVCLCLAAWAVPGAGHLWLGRTVKGIAFLVVLSFMFAVGLLLEGRLFPFQWSEPLVALAAAADAGIGVLYLLARLFDLGEGRVVAASYEHGSTFLIVAGLLNLLVVLDAYDIAVGRK